MWLKKRGTNNPKAYYLITCGEDQKVCSVCRTAKPKTEFSKRATSQDGLASLCKVCGRAASKRWADANRDRVNIVAKAWREANKEYTAARDKEEYWLNRDEIRQERQKYRDKNRKKIRSRHIEMARMHWEVIAARRCKTRAKKQNIPFSLRPEDLLPLPKYCSVFGIKLDYNVGPDMRYHASVDRIIPRLGYVAGNIRVISFSANAAKLNGEGDIITLKGRKTRKPPVDPNQGSLFDF